MDDASFAIAKRQSDTIEKLVRDLREMDQLVYQMQTSGSADQLRSAVNRAWAITQSRMRAESDRIADILIPEIKKVYSEHDIPALIESKSTQRRLK